MGAVWIQAFPNHETGLGIKVCRRESFDPERKVKVTDDLLVKEMKLVRSFPYVSSTCHQVPTVLHLLSRTRQLRSTDIEIGEACELGNRGST